MSEGAEAQRTQTVRLDKWLWAARFYRTRSIAKQSIEAGHVRCQGERVKVSRSVRIGDPLSVRQGSEDREVVVTGLSEQRRDAASARFLYEETADSLAAREQQRLLRKSGPMFDPARPDRKQRRDGARFKRGET